jgi:oligoribonuclease
MTGLEVGKDKIIEVAAIITDKDLVPFHEGFEKIISCSQEMLDGMDDWCTRHHGDVPPPATTSYHNLPTSVPY